MPLKTNDLYKGYRAPKNHGDALISPSFGEAAELIRENQTTRSQHPMASIRPQARKQLIASAFQPTSQYRDVSDLNRNSDCMVLSGHQPTLCHPGVWFKNFALSKIAEQQNATAVNLVIDNDVAIGSSIRVPVIETASGGAYYEAIDFDDAGGGVPFEQMELRDHARFDSFANRVTKTIAPLVETPCINHLWMHAQVAKQRSNNLGTIFAEARHSLETHCNLRTLEVPLSHVCETRSFLEFILHLVGDLPRFHQCYNDSVAHYRTAHGIRSSSHPVPNLRKQDEWLEAPLWIYGDGDPNRRPSWIKLSKEHLTISDGNYRERTIHLNHPDESVEELAAALGPDFKIRPRALVTTMYARMILSDLFLHGIGGGKYDQLGDQIARSFFGSEPTHYIVISATALLPAVQTSILTNNTRQLTRSIRDTIYQPERFAGELDLPAGLLQQKRELLQEIPRKGQRKQWHRQMELINRELAAGLADRRSVLEQELKQDRVRSAAHRIIANREHPFCLFDLNYLMETFESMLTETIKSK